jgi:hypothetical protein
MVTPVACLATQSYDATSAEMVVDVRPRHLGQQIVVE